MNLQAVADVAASVHAAGPQNPCKAIKQAWN